MDKITDNNEYDGPWKLILETHFQAFMEFCCPDAARAIDWSKKHEFLDVELAKIAPKSATGKRMVDKLVKVHLLSGESAKVLVHVEVQTQKDAEFEERMLTYHYRLFDKHKKPILSVAILADDNHKWRPSDYHHELWGCSLDFKFRTIKLLDLAKNEDILTNSKNPFSLVVLAHIEAMRTKANIAKRLDVKISLTKKLFKNGLVKEEVIDFLRFIDWILVLPDNYEIQYHENIQCFKEEEVMEYMLSSERLAMKKGLLQGREEGREEGRVETVLELLNSKFHAIPDSYMQIILNADQKQITHWLSRIWQVDTLPEVFEDLTES